MIIPYMIIYYSFDLKFGRISTIYTPSGIEFVAGSSWTTISVDPTAVIAGNEPGITTLHFAEGRTPAGILRSGDDGSNEGCNSDEERSHF